MNLDGITALIIIVGIVNVVILILTHISVNKLRNIIYPHGDRRNGVQIDLLITDEESTELGRASALAASLYTWYTNITAIFPLLGIFGTVVSLMQISETAGLSANFSMALKTTAAGLIFAMFFKALDSTVSSRLDRALDEADYLIHQHDEEKRKNYAPQAETGYRY